MGVNKVIFDGEPLIDLTEDTVTADDMASGVTAHAANGEQITGTLVKASPSDTAPLMDDIAASAGSSTAYARGDHVHPTDTTRAPKNHRDMSAAYGQGNGVFFGHLRLDDSVKDDLGQGSGFAATPSAVKKAYDLADSKQDKLTFDNTPTEDSENPVTSGGVYAALAEKAGTGDLPAPSTTTPLMDGTASAGSSANYARGDHRHPTDTSRAPNNHQSTATSYGVGTGTYYGHVKLSDSVSSASGVSGGVAATPAAVKTVNDSLGTFVRPNLLDNWYFVGGGSQQGGGQFPINQRGETSYTSAGYTIDRWKQINPYSTVSIVNDGLQISESGYGAGGAIFDQLFENYDNLTGKVCTVSILVSAISGSYRLQCGGQNLDITSTGLHSVKIDSYTSGGIGVRLFNRTANASITIQAVKLELGSTQTLAHQDSSGNWVLNEVPNFQQELARCRRYYMEWGVGVFGLMQSGLLVFASPFYAPMRVAPTLSLKTTTIPVFDGEQEVDITNSFILVQATTPYGVSACGIQGTFSSNISIGKTVRLNMNSNIVVASADL